MGVGGFLAGSCMFYMVRSRDLQTGKTSSDIGILTGVDPCRNGLFGNYSGCSSYTPINEYALDHTSKAVFAGLASEIIGTCVMCLATLVVCYNNDFSDATGAYMLGLSVFLGIGAGSKIGAGCLNPLRSNAPWMFHPGKMLANWVFNVGPGLGALLSALVYKTCYETSTNNNAW